MSYTDKILLVALNSKYIHSNTAIYYLRKILTNKGFNTDTGTFTVNMQKDEILAKIMSHEPDMVCFSCYIWNIGLVYGLCTDIKKIRKDMKIILGGPEVSFECSDALGKSGADCIIRGEGEEVAAEAVEMVLSGDFKLLRGCFHILDGETLDGGYAMTGDLDAIPSPFDSYMKKREKGKLIYYEASRGCPFNCVYCLSSSFKGVRYFSDERIFSDIGKIVGFNPPTVKFTDRSFNINIEKTLAILDFIAGLDTDTCFHLEIYPAYLDEKVAKRLKTMPRGRVQIEAGIQSVNKKTLEMSGRPQDSAKALRNAAELAEAGNLHVHLDLIAGLPGEDHDSFANSFDTTMKSGPHVLQIAFLKMLKGTAVREIEGYVYSGSPPYEVLSTPWLDYEGLVGIKEVSECVDVFYNSGKFTSSLKHMHSVWGSPFEFYKKTSKMIRQKGFFVKAMSVEKRYKVMAEMAEGDALTTELLRFDHMKSSVSRRIPVFLGKTGVDNDALFEFLKKPENIEETLPAYVGMNAKQIFKKCAMGRFVFSDGTHVFLFDYGARDPVSGLFPAIEVRID